MRSAGVVFWLLPSWAMTLTVPLSRSAVCLSTFFFYWSEASCGLCANPLLHLSSLWQQQQQQRLPLTAQWKTTSAAFYWHIISFPFLSLTLLFFGSAASSFRLTDAGVCRRGPAVCVGEHGVNWHWGQVGYFKTVLFIQKKTHWSTLFYNSWLSSVMHHVTEYIALYHGCVFLH